MIRWVEWDDDERCEHGMLTPKIYEDGLHEWWHWLDGLKRDIWVEAMPDRLELTERIERQQEKLSRYWTT